MKKHNHKVPLVMELTYNYLSNIKVGTHQYIPFNSGESIVCADWYENMEHCPNVDVVQSSYSSFVKHLILQFEYLLNAGVNVINGEGRHEYATSDDLRKDLHMGRVYYLPTYANDGSYSEVPEGHPLAGYHVINGQLYCLNDIFRIVHDFYGHGKGHSFGPQGEHYAWVEHRMMFPQEAHLALWCETRAQSSWVNFGKHIREANGYIPPKDRPFAQQKCGLPPLNLI